MGKAVVINGSPRLAKGNTALILTAFVQGLEDAGAEVELFYASRLNVKPCDCGQMLCWYKTPGECYHKGPMQQLYPALRQAEHLILATPVYIPLPGAMQNIINRLCPLLLPKLDYRDGRTRAQFRDEVNIKQIALVSAGGWWELGNLDTVVRIAEELAATASVNYGGSLLRPHANLMRDQGVVTDKGKTVLAAVETAGYELISDGFMHKETLETISQSLVSRTSLQQRYNSIA